MKRPYISGPMSNIEHHNFPAFFNAENELEDRGYFPINPARRTAKCTWETAVKDISEHPESWESCIRRDIQQVMDSDSIVLLSGWNTSRGACLELVLSVSIGNPVLVWFPGREPVFIEDPALHYDMAIDHLKTRGIISPIDMYNVARPALS